jgi:hypothetical protein
MPPASHEPRLLSSVSSRAPQGSAANRWHEIDLHDLQPGYRLTIRFRSLWTHQGDRETIRQLIALTPDDLCRDIALINPCSDYPPDPRHFERLRTDCSLRSAWFAAIVQLLRESQQRLR